MASVSHDIIERYAANETVPANDNGWGMILRSDGLETRISPILTDDFLEIVRVIKHDAVWLSEEGQMAVGTLSRLLEDHL